MLVEGNFADAGRLLYVHLVENEIGLPWPPHVLHMIPTQSVFAQSA